MKAYNIYLPVWLWERVKDYAESRGQSASAEIRRLLVEEFERGRSGGDQ